VLFNSPEFFVLLASTLGLYWATPLRWMRFCALLGASLMFYAFWYPPYLLILLVLCAAAYPVALILSRIEGQRANWLLAGFLAFILGVLGYFKYTGYFAELAQPLLAKFGVTLHPEALGVALPLGISFFTFQLIAYVADVRMRRFPAERNPLMVLLFICFFPHLIAGPICRPHQLIPQLDGERRFDPRALFGGGAVLAAGLFLKAGFADNLAPFVNRVFDRAGESTGTDAALAAVAFGIQILSDFWGYSTMALGMAMMFGVFLPLNFNLPYVATTLQSFWRRWHMTLSNWLRDYLYIPLGGSRRGPTRTSINLIITMALGGLWHGAATTFVAWGLIHGGYLVVERWAVNGYARFAPPGGRLAAAVRPLTAPVGWLVTMTVVFAAWVFFRASSVPEALQILARAVHFHAGWDQAPRRIVVLIAAFAVVMVPLHLLIDRGLKRRLSVPWAVAAAFWLTFLSLALQAPEPVPFIYFQF